MHRSHRGSRKSLRKRCSSARVKKPKQKGILSSESNESLSKEYITNLQQQVYLLEVENRLLKTEKSHDAEKERERVEAASVMPPQLPLPQAVPLHVPPPLPPAPAPAPRVMTPPAPKRRSPARGSLESHMRAVRDEFDETLERSRRRVQELEAMCDISEIKLRKQTRQLQEMRLRSAKTDRKWNTMEEHERELENRHSEEKYRLERRLSDLEEKLQDKNSELEKLREEFKEFRIDKDAEFEKQADQFRTDGQHLEHLRKDNADLREQTKDALARVVELNDLNDAQTTHEKLLKDSTRLAQDRASELEFRVSRLKSELERERSAHKDTGKRCADLCRSVDVLRNELSESKNTNKSLESRIRDRAQKIASLEVSMPQLKKSVEKAKAAELHQLSLADQARRSKSAATDALRQAKAALQNAKTDRENLQRKLDEIQEVNIAFSHENMLKTREIDRLRSETESARASAELTRNKNIELQSTIDHLHSKLRTIEILETLDWEQVDNLSTSNIRVASKIESLRDAYAMRDAKENECAQRDSISSANLGSGRVISHKSYRSDESPGSAAPEEGSLGM